VADPFTNLPRGYYGAILADPPWRFYCWADSDKAHGSANTHYSTMNKEEIQDLPVAQLAAPDCVLFIWICWPNLLESLETITAWGFQYKTCAFSWMKADGSQLEMFQDHIETYMGLGYWTRANSEMCLLATRGNPKRLNADVKQGIIAPRREHSRKPDGVHQRIERLVSGPYLELFARQRRPNWDCWGNETDKFGDSYDSDDDVTRSLEEAYRVIRERVAAGGPGWEPK
jgi:N6-adenosine-specific RNA methylase IME4